MLKNILTNINEGSEALLVVDVQPGHASAIGFDIYMFTDYLNSYKGSIYYVFNGPDLGYEDEDELREWLIEEHGLEYDVSENINFVEKDYGWIRDPMDAELGSDKDIATILKYMIKKGYSDVRDLDSKELNKLKIDDDFNDEIQQMNTSFGLPSAYEEFKNFPNKGIIVGGGEYECLQEMEITLTAMNKKYKRNRNFIY